MEDPKQHVIDSLKQATNILVTVRKNPSIDQLSACIALTLIVNALDKHGTAVFSGKVPSMLDFLQPDKTIERNTDSLQDFIISLDKAKADKLRYKVEDTVVKIFITPYRTSLSNKDLEFGQGDFNVDVVVALGVHSQEDVDEAITAHGRILHDATVISINTDGGAAEDLGSISWVNPNVSSLSEMIYDISGSLGKDDVVDNQTATALLTGIVAETERFGNAKTTPHTMEIAAKLLTAGANQELVAAQLTAPEKPQPIAASTVMSDNHDDAGDSNDKADYDGQGGGSTSGKDEMPSLLDADDQKNGGELDIDHPYSATNNPVEAAAVESPSFDAPQGGDLTSQLLAPDNADENKGDQPSFSQPPLDAGLVDTLAQAPAEASPPTEEEAALDYLKGRKVDSTANMRGRLEPLTIEPTGDQNGYLEGTPQHDPDEFSRFALTPPSLGGTLTASMTSDHDTPASNPMANKSAVAPLLQHEKPGAKSEDEPKVPEPLTESLVAPLITEQSPPPASEAKPSPATPAHQTLADLEQQLHARHASDTAANQTPAGAMDMPQPSKPTVSLPSPLTEVLKSSAPTSAPTSPPPVPPPLPPLPA